MATPHKTPGNRTPLECDPLGVGTPYLPRTSGRTPGEGTSSSAKGPAMGPTTTTATHSSSSPPQLPQSFLSLLLSFTPSHSGSPGSGCCTVIFHHPKKRQCRGTAKNKGERVKYQLQTRLDPGAPQLSPQGLLLIPPAQLSGPDTKTGTQGHLSFLPQGCLASCNQGQCPPLPPSQLLLLGDRYGSGPGSGFQHFTY